MQQSCTRSSRWGVCGRWGGEAARAAASVGCGWVGGGAAKMDMQQKVWCVGMKGGGGKAAPV
eukprot:359013-Chlamydomonas_euryale.AAC.13